ncbi:MAG: sigma-54 dependent transcriptional regulator [Chitinispirillia bacterium]|nr:sigma-54 dependent transcriptional regulator [Chitinispirillia bacterium]
MHESSHYRPYFGTGQNISRVVYHINAAAAVNCTVLILGETGSGKGVVASRIHGLSARKNHPFVDINCSGLQGELLKSELFGHAKGSFTGALGDHTGLIEEADGGTLFLDEIGDMPKNVQCLLLKAIEEKSFRRVGENGTRSSDFRLICATNRSLPEAMKHGAFRPDLFYRINTFNITIPPLRERQADIPSLISHILKEMGHSHPVADDVINALTRYRWPGNIRELRNALERAIIFAKDAPLTAEHFAGLGDYGSAEEAKTEGPWAAARMIETDGNHAWPTGQNGSPIWNLKELETCQILRALKAFDGDKAKACEALGISMSSLYRKLEAILGNTLEEAGVTKGGDEAEEA